MSNRGKSKRGRAKKIQVTSTRPKDDPDAFKRSVPQITSAPTPIEIR